MNTTTREFRHVLLSAILAASLSLTLVSPAFAGDKGNQNPGVLPPNSNPYGQAYGDWGDRWWQWASSFPLSGVNPVTDTTGQYAALGQSGPVWLLAGDYGGEVHRTVTVPTGKGLFFPIFDTLWVNLPDYGDNPWSPQQETFARGVLADQLKGVTDLGVEIDGRAVQSIAAYRSPTPEGHAFMVTMPDDNSFGIPAGTYGPSVSDGYFLMLAPLSAGEHSLHITAAQPAINWSLDVTYDLTVMGGKASAVPEPSTLALLGMGAVGVLTCVWRRGSSDRQPRGLGRLL